MSGVLSAAGGKRRSSAVVVLHGDAYDDDYTIPGSGTASFNLLSSGTAFGDFHGGYPSYTWLTGGVASDYDVKATLTSGTFSTGTAGSWLALSSNRTWTVAHVGTGGKGATATFQIRRISDSVIVATASIDLSAVGS